jgi:hypothetical protein
MTVYLVKSGKLAGHYSIYDLKIRTVPDIKVLAEELWKTRKNLFRIKIISSWIRYGSTGVREGV